ncbi:MAG: MMPL family transporter [Candidatus Thalassarchaeaceae archaeon]|jgi:hypothetical protein|nr:MMPL family transporter [Candidatus Thalassarchaeaceae archaeon]
MQNPFDRLSEISVDRPKTTIAVIFIGIIFLSSFARFIVFEVGEDSFFPQNETTELLYEVEGTYTVDADLIRVIVRFDDGDLLESDTWELLASVEYDLLAYESLSDNHLALFGDSANAGPASSVIFWQKIQDPNSDTWSSGVEGALQSVLSANNSTLNDAIGAAMTSVATIPPPTAPTLDDISSWNPGNPTEWQTRIDSGKNNSERISHLIGLVSALSVNRTTEQLAVIAPLQGAVMGALIPLNELQKIDLRANMITMFPNDARSEPWAKASIALVTLAIDTSEPIVEGEALDVTLTECTIDIEKIMIESHNDEITVFSFSRFLGEQTSTIGKEIGILTSTSLVVLGIILWWKFRSVRDTSIVLTLTLLAIAATYGVSGLMKMEFNAAMNSIPILLLAIGVDYGLHVVLRYREELKLIDGEDNVSRDTMADFSADLRAKALKTGTILTSAALVVAIVTDMVGFLSFRLSSQKFLVTFGTVIAIGLFFIYLLSVTLLPAILRLSKAQKLPLNRAVKVDEDAFSKWVGNIVETPWKVIAAAVLLSLPVAMGVQHLEVGFDADEQFDVTMPVVEDFFLLGDEFGGQNRDPLYVVMDGSAISIDGKATYESAIATINSNSNINVYEGLWDTLEIESSRNPELQSLLSSLGSEQSYVELEYWLLNNETGRDISFRYLSPDGQQSVISFQTPTTDWKATVNFVDDLSNSLSEHGEYRLSGRGLILAQVSEDVAFSSVASTGIVASVILFTLILINVSREENKVKGIVKGFTMWVPLAVVVLWVYGLMGWTGYQLNSQTVTIGALTLGLGVDYSVHFVTRLDEEIEHTPSAGTSAWVSKTNATTGRAMMGAALTTAGGFAVLNLSSLLPLRLFGQAFVVAILLALISSIILLPALFSLFGLIPKPTLDSEE